MLRGGIAKDTRRPAPASTLALGRASAAGIRVFARAVQDERVLIVIRRLTDRHRAYTGIFLPGEPPRIFPTSDAEHGRILQIYKQDRPHDGIINDFSEFALGQDSPLPEAPAPHSTSDTR